MSQTPAVLKLVLTEEASVARERVVWSGFGRLITMEK